MPYYQTNYKKRQKKRISITLLFRFLSQKIKKILTIKVVSFNIIQKFFKSSNKQRKSYLRKDIHKKSFSNPYNKKSRSKKVVIRYITEHRNTIAQLILLGIICIWIFVVFITPTFYLTNIKIEGNEEIQKDDLLTIVTEHFNNRNLLFVKKFHLFFLDLNDLEHTIREKYGLESIKFVTHWPSKTILIKMTEKVSVLAYSVQDNYYTIDRQGTIIRQINEIESKGDIPVIYQYDKTEQPEVGTAVLTPGNISMIIQLYDALKKYPSFSIHSFRIKSAPKREITLVEKNPKVSTENEKNDEVESRLLDQVAESIANAKTTDEKITTLRNSIAKLNIEKIGENDINKILDYEKVYKPDDSFQINELEVYMLQGWSLKLGHELLKDENKLNEYLSIFATLNNEVAIGEKVKEYVDLRFPDRIYYR